MNELDAFEAWVPSDYLKEYYSELQEDERSTLKYFVEQIRTAPSGPLLCFGCGPTVHHVLLAAERVTEIYLADYVPENLAEIERWQRRDPGSHDWSPFAAYVLFCEAGTSGTSEAVEARLDLLRSKIVRRLHADAHLTDPLGPEYRGFFSAVISPYCAESATGDRATWSRFCRNIASLVRPGGLFLTSALRLSRGYKSGDRFFPATPIDEADLRQILLEDFRADSIGVETRELRDHSAQGFSGILLARGVR